MAKRLTVAQVVQRWSDRGAASGETVKAGVQAVQNSPMEAAAAKKAEWFAALTRVNQGTKWEDNLRAVSLAEWKAAMLNKGLQNMQNGYTNGKAKFQRFMNDWLPFAQQISVQIKAMPKGTLQQGIDRAIAAIRMAAQFRRGQNIAPMPRPVG